MSTTPADITARPMAHEAIHHRVLEILDPLPRGTLLDIPAGEGALTQNLIRIGFDARCCDLYPELFRLQGVEIRRGDMRESLPYSAESFDYIVCIEGLEHIVDPQKAIREFARLLRQGGRLIVSIPNILNIEERVKWLLFGYTSHFKPLSREYLREARREWGESTEIGLHVHAVSYSELRYHLEENGFEIIRLYRDKKKARLWIYWPMALLVRLLNYSLNRQKRKERWIADLQSDEVLMGGNTLIFEAQKIE